MNAWTIAATIYATTVGIWFGIAAGAYAGWKDAANRVKHTRPALAAALNESAKGAAAAATVAPLWPLAALVLLTSKRGRRG